MVLLLLIGVVIYLVTRSGSGSSSTGIPRAFPGASRTRSADAHSSEFAASIADAIRRGKDIEITYTNAQGVRSRRIVRPMRLADYEYNSGEGGSLCVEGHCRLRNENRTFAIKRIGTLDILE